jgi:ribosomal protein S18 acetylase RimI-like enzyme
MYCPADLAARIERADGRFCASLADLIRHEPYGGDVRVSSIDGGVAVFTRAGSPISRWMGAGFGTTVDLKGLDALEAHFASHQASLTAWVSSLAAPALATALAQRGYETHGFEHVLGHALRQVEAAPASISVTHATPEQADTVAALIAEAFAQPDDDAHGGAPLPALDRLRRSTTLMTRVDGYRGYIARVGDELAGSATLWIDGGLAHFIGAGTVPRFRRRGVQTALLRARLADAARAGCTMAVVGTLPGSKSQQNAQREGFAVLYARQRFVKPATDASPR